MSYLDFALDNSFDEIIDDQIWLGNKKAAGDVQLMG